MITIVSLSISPIPSQPKNKKNKTKTRGGIPKLQNSQIPYRNPLPSKSTKKSRVKSAENDPLLNQDTGIIKKPRDKQEGGAGGRVDSHRKAKDKDKTQTPQF
jgi:hypothetical protein